MNTSAPAEDSDWTVAVASPVEKFPVLARVGLAAVCLVGAVAITAFVLPVLLPESLVRPSAEEALSRITGIPVKIDGSVSFKLLPSVELNAKRIRAAEPGQVVRELSIRELDLSVESIGLVRGEVNVDHVSFVEPRAVVAWGASPGGAGSGMPAEKAEVDLSWGWWRDMGISSLKISGGGVGMVDRGSGRRIEATDINLQSRPPATDEPKDGIVVEGKAAVNGRETSLFAVMADLRLLVSGSRWPTRARLTSPLLTAEFRGSFAARDRMMGVGTFTVSSPDAAALDDWIGPLSPLPLAGALNIAGNVNVVGDRVEARQVQLTAGRTAASGDMFFSGLLGGDLAVDGRMQARLIDLGRLDLKDAATSMAFDRMPVGRLEFTWDELQIGEYRAGKGHLTLTRAPDRPRVRVELNDAQIFNGSARAELTLDAAEGTHAISGSFRLIGADIQMLTGHATDLSPPVKGQLSVDATFLSVGANAGEILKALQGRAEVSATDGVLEIRELAEKLVPGQGARIEFATFNATVDVSQGIGHADDVILRAPKVSFVGAGKFDLAAGVADLDVKRLEAAGAGRETKEFRVHGELGDLKIDAVN